MKLPNGYGSVTKMSGKRRKPYIVRITAGWDIDTEKESKKQISQVIGYAKTKAEGLQLLAEYRDNPIDLSTSKLTFTDIYKKWSKEKFNHVSESHIKGFQASYNVCGELYNKPFKDIRLRDLQRIVDTCGKNYPTLKKLKVLFNQLYSYALKHDITRKDYSEFVDILKYKDKNPNRVDRDKFSKKEIDTIWTLSEDKYYQIVLMLIYTGVRVSELLNLKKENINLEKQYFDVIDSKTENGIRKVPIADKILPFFDFWYNNDDRCNYLLHNEYGRKFAYRNYYDSYFKPLMKNLNYNYTPHCCRHTCISMLVEAGVDQTTIKKIVGHAGAMTLTEKVYTHLDIGELVKAINKI